MIREWRDSAAQTPRQRPSSARQHLGDRDCRDGEAQPSRGVRLEERPESWREFEMIFQM